MAQDVYLFAGTIAENIAYGRPDATRSEIEDAAEAAAADGFIRATPAGSETLVAERGVALSGGQRQRLALARALLSDPGIWCSRTAEWSSGSATTSWSGSTAATRTCGRSRPAGPDRRVQTGGAVTAGQVRA